LDGGRSTWEASASALRAASGSSSRTCVPPIVQRKAAPAERPKKERRVVLGWGIRQVADILSADRGSVLIR
jgi:hypothetical protein